MGKEHCTPLQGHMQRHRNPEIGWLPAHFLNKGFFGNTALHLWCGSWCAAPACWIRWICPVLMIVHAVNLHSAVVENSASSSLRVIFLFGSA